MATRREEVKLKCQLIEKWDGIKRWTFWIGSVDWAPDGHHLTSHCRKSVCPVSPRSWRSVQCGRLFYKLGYSFMKMSMRRSMLVIFRMDPQDWKKIFKNIDKSLEKIVNNEIKCLVNKLNVRFATSIIYLASKLQNTWEFMVCTGNSQYLCKGDFIIPI